MNDETGKVYYHNSVTDETTWSFPGEDLPANAATDAPPTTTAMDAAATRVNPLGKVATTGADDDFQTSSTEQQQPSSSFKLQRTKSVRKFVRWKFKARDDATLADALLGSVVARGRAWTGCGGGGRRSATSDFGHDGKKARPPMPTYMMTMFDEIFTDADTNISGSLSTIQLMNMLKRRAKVGVFRYLLSVVSFSLSHTYASDSRHQQGTALDGNAQKIFALRTLLAAQAEHGDIGREEFATGLFKAISREPNGAPLLLKAISPPLTFSHPPLAHNCFLSLSLQVQQHSGSSWSSWSKPSSGRNMKSKKIVKMDLVRTGDVSMPTPRRGRSSGRNQKCWRRWNDARRSCRTARRLVSLVNS